MTAKTHSLRACMGAGGPAGGNGGNGGAVWAVADAGLNSLTPFRRQLHYRAGPGANGGGSARHGANGSDLDILVGAWIAVAGICMHACLET